MPLTLVVNLDVPDEVILSRISDRWVHLPSGRVYNMSYNAPRVHGFDDQTGEPLTKRPDDNPVRTLSVTVYVVCIINVADRTFLLDASMRFMPQHLHCCPISRNRLHHP
jgi:adenylate kinase family enzyme